MTRGPDAGVGTSSSGLGVASPWPGSATDAEPCWRSTGVSGSSVRRSPGRVALDVAAREDRLQVRAHVAVGVEAEHGVGLGQLVGELLAVALGEAADGDDLLRAAAVALEVGGLEQRVDGVLLGLLDEAARVDDGDVGLGRVVDETPALREQPTGQLLGVDLVARAPEGDECDALVGARVGRGHASTLDAGVFNGRHARNRPPRPRRPAHAGARAAPASTRSSTATTTSRGRPASRPATTSRPSTSSSRLTTTQTDLPRLAEGGVGAQFWSVFVPSTLQGDSAVTATLEQVDGVHRMIGTYADRLALARTADEVEAATRVGPRRLAPRRRGRSLDRLLARHPAAAARARRALPDADAQRQHAVGRLGDRRARRRRPQRVRPRGRARDEPSRDDGRPQPRRRPRRCGPRSRPPTHRSSSATPRRWPCATPPATCPTTCSPRCPPTAACAW